MKKLKIVFDYDGPLHDIVGAVCNIAGLDKRTWKTYRIDTNDTWDEETKQRVIELCNQADTFRENGIRPEAKRLIEIEDTGKAEVYIHSLNWREEVAIAKTELIHKDLTWLPHNRILMDVGDTKTILEDVDILVEDCAKNLENSKAKQLNIFMILDSVEQKCEAKNLVTTYCLNETIDFILNYLKDIDINSEEEDGEQTV